MKDAIILSKLKKLSKENIVSFHIPGHKNGKIYQRYNKKYFPESILSLDVTEIPGTDNLHNPEEMIKEAQDQAAKFFEAEHTFFLINGTSTGNISALMTVANPNEKVIVARDCHKSVMHGLILGGLIPVYITPEVSKESNIPMGIKPEKIEKAIVKNPDVKAVILTYPNYYGICSDIEAIANIVHKYEKILIVDEAHGSHFNLSEDLPIPAIKAGADIVVQSIHKTLPSFTQSSMLHVKSNRVDIERLRFMLMMNQSSSPSYLLMSSLDVARAISENEGKSLMKELLESIDYFHEKIANEEGIKVLDKNLIGKYGVKNIDKTRLVIDMTKLGISGITLDKLLRERYKIQMEMSDINNVVAVCTIGNDRKDFEKLLKALINIKKEITYKKIYLPPFFYHVPKMKITPRDAAFRKKTAINFEESIGKISGEYIIPYPPGIPILCPGEEITDEIIIYIKSLKERGINIIGMDDVDLEKIKVI
ncbi:aminotransferase class I/II-fold pyridoxal phosphate-dependent enzyme [Crassaminicella thermophila]|uniref:Aminotransferase class I/II-fold pyridoxal phosphate-dependent enzyme n=1 Tax=Crassaminicella thermophila TaxID=2599308 RepID=A0A5C0SBM3_CRATE|nr:aminotransferase class I/II-fold pyridoxal phosphate-dependent enzyme [Crassaminicella thermophila]QEK10908.1 aminotransferase class I/II-fold pyridoxal phosphate-dependent enzyme [Crassaminicella thermophila]